MNAIGDIKLLFGQRVRELRLSQGLSQEKLGQICGLDRTYISSVERGHRNVSIENISAIAQALDINLTQLFRGLSIDGNKDILERWKLTETELTSIVLDNPSLRGFMLGYVAEHKVRDFLSRQPQISGVRKPDDHDRRGGSKNDMIAIYKGREFSFEIKSLQTNSIKFDNEKQVYDGRAQVDASDRRPVSFPDGSQLQTTCLLVGQFDILVLNLFQFRQEWDFAFILNRDLPRTNYRKYTEYQRRLLLATTVKVTFPIRLPYSESPLELLECLSNE